jgi:hypothetical protein
MVAHPLTLGIIVNIASIGNISARRVVSQFEL